MSPDYREKILLFCCREAEPARRLEGREDSRDLPGGVKGVRGQPAQAQVRHDLREAAFCVDRAADTRQPEQRDVLQFEVQEQKAASFPRRDLGRDTLVSPLPIPVG